MLREESPENTVVKDRITVGKTNASNAKYYSSTVNKVNIYCCLNIYKSFSSFVQTFSTV